MREDDNSITISLCGENLLEPILGYKMEMSRYPFFLEKLEIESVIKNKSLQIKKVIYNGPTTIVIWKDDSKTVVRCMEGDTYDAEKGLLLAIMKKLFGNDNKFKKELKKWGRTEGAKEE